MKKILEFLKKVFTFIHIVKVKQRERLKEELKVEIKAELLNELADHFDTYLHDELTSQIVDEITDILKPKKKKMNQPSKLKTTATNGNCGVIPEYYYE